MNHKVLFNEFLQMNKAEMNKILAKANLLFLALCPMLFLMNQSHLVSYETGTMLEICLAIIVFSVTPYIFSVHAYNDDIIRIVTLTCMEILICMIGFNGYAKVSLIFVLVPLVSLLYLEESIFLNAARYCLVGELVVYGCRIYEQIQSNMHAEYKLGYQDLIFQVLEYVILMIVLYNFGKVIRDLVFSGYRLEKTEEGNYTTAIEARLEAEGHEEEVYHTKDLFLEVNHELQSMVRGKEKTMMMEVDYDLPMKLYGDREKIKLMLINIMRDFLQYTQQGTVTLAITYEKGVRAKRGNNITMIFRLQCSEDISEDLRYGTALGFALAKNMIQRMNGVILDKSSTVGVRQTAYTISIIQRVEQEDSLQSDKERNRELQMEILSDSRRQAQDILWAKMATALVIDDSESDLRLMKAIMKSYGMTVVCAQGADKGIEILRNNKGFDMVFIDHMMPQKGGIQAAKEIRQLGDAYYEQLPLLALSTNLTEESKQSFYDCGFKEVIPKPIKEEELRAAITNCMFLS